MTMYKVHNGTKQDFSQRYDGVLYEFPAGKSVVCPEDAARHIFGLGNHDKDAILLRNGWTKPGQPKHDGLAILAAFKFDLLVPEYDAPMAAVSEPALGVSGAGAAGSLARPGAPASILGAA